MTRTRPSRRPDGEPARRRSSAGRPFAGRVLPLLMLLLTIFLVYRVERLLASLGLSSFDSPPVHAQESPTPRPAPERAQAAGGGKAEGSGNADRPGAAHESGGRPTAVPEGGAGLSRSERDLVRDLQEQRRRLVERENRLALREQLLAATERRIKAELDELKRVKEEIRALLAEQDAKQNEKLRSLVKVYETMKPKDAARIFERLSMQIQIAVARQMKEAKMAALLANMNPNAAKNLTTALATPRKVPDLDEILAGRKRQKKPDSQ